jgi:hypothetical protein
LREEPYGFVDMPRLDVFALETLAQHQQWQRNCQGPFALDELICEYREGPSGVIQAGFAERLLDCRRHQDVGCPTTLIAVESVVVAPKWIIVARPELSYLEGLAAYGMGNRVSAIHPIWPLGSLRFEQETIEQRDRDSTPVQRAVDEETFGPENRGECRLGDYARGPDSARIPDAGSS